MGTMSVPLVMPLGPTVSTTPATLTSSLTHLVLSAQQTHRQPLSSKEAQPSGEASSVHGEGSHTGTIASSCGSHGELSHNKSRTAFFMNYRFTQWESDLHKHYELYDDPEVALEVGCPIKSVDHWDEWEWLCSHFEDEIYLVRGSKFMEIDIFKEVYVRPRDELMEQLHSTMVEKGQTVLEEVASQLPLETPIEEVFPSEDAGFQIMIDTLDQTLGRWHGNVHRGLRKARLRDPSTSSSEQRNEEVETLTFEMVNLKERIAT
ncbi:hypothetical protein C1H46_019245 [Malus baccata]|uniref:Uncharacterized protein n=1 Tax=Malus baccata TaxID=106549 RepID=A0A540M8Z9_MALBA|nr:hypothetical protein C1H46_019245 [Malus baccata]